MDHVADPALPDVPPLPRPDMTEGQMLRTDLLGDLVVPGRIAGTAELQDLATRAAEYASRARGDGTRRVYRAAWRGYEAWCRSLGREPLSGDPQLLAM